MMIVDLRPYHSEALAAEFDPRSDSGCNSFIWENLKEAIKSWMAVATEDVADDGHCMLDPTIVERF